MRKIWMAMPLAVVLLLLGGTNSAKAGSYTFDFTGLAPATSSMTAAQDTAAVQTYMSGVLGCTGCSVTVSGAVADQTYNGDGHVVGPGGVSLTLGNTNNATSNTGPVGSTDTFIANTSDSKTQISSQITLTFKGLTVTAVSFDYEIFPDGSCTTLTASGCGGSPNGVGIYPNQPDLKFEAGTNTNGIDPVVSLFGTNGVQDGVAPGGGNGTSLYSPNSGASKELAPQYIGHWSGSLNNVTELDFIDWPATIGIDNLTITTPEPSMFLLLGIGLSGLFLPKKRHTA